MVVVVVAGTGIVGATVTAAMLGSAVGTTPGWVTTGPAGGGEGAVVDGAMVVGGARALDVGGGTVAAAAGGREVNGTAAVSTGIGRAVVTAAFFFDFEVTTFFRVFEVFALGSATRQARIFCPGDTTMNRQSFAGARRRDLAATFTATFVAAPVGAMTATPSTTLNITEVGEANLMDQA